MQESNSDSNNAAENVPAENDGESDIGSSMDETRGVKRAPKKQKTKALKIAGALSMVLWIVGFILPFVLSSTSPYRWLSDTFLLVGFWPVLFVYRAGWTWVVFGVLNMVLGFGLEVIKFLVFPDVWTPETLQFKPWFLHMHKHIIDMHPSMPWILIGAASTIYGIFRIGKTIVKWSYRKVTGVYPAEKRS